MSRRSAAAVLAAGLALGALTACSTDAATPATPVEAASASPESSMDLGDCAPPFLTTVTAGQLTVGVPIDVDAPYVSEERNSKARIGLEADVVVAIAEAMGFRRTSVFWEDVEVDPGAVVVPDSVDVVIGQIPIPPPGVATAAFTAPYLDVRQVVVARSGTPAASATGLADLRGLRFAAVSGSRGAAALAASVRPTAEITEITGPDAGASALRRGAADAVVLDLVDAGRVVAASDGALVIVGQLPPGAGDTALGLAVAPGNPLLACVDRAVAEVAASGAVDAGLDAWLGTGARRPLAS